MEMGPAATSWVFFATVSVKHLTCTESRSYREELGLDPSLSVCVFLELLVSAAQACVEVCPKRKALRYPQHSIFAQRSMILS